jgi:hypothetical protein
MNKHFVIHPDGTKSTRQSRNRTYTYAVAVGPDKRDDLVKKQKAVVANFEASYTRYDDIINYLEVGGEIKLRNHDYLGKMWHATELRALAQSRSERVYGTTILYAREAAEAGIDIDDSEAVRNLAITQITEYRTSALARVTKAKAKLAEIEAGPELQGNWGVLTWNSRRDLSEKAASAFRTKTTSDVVVVEVERVGA